MKYKIKAKVWLWGGGEKGSWHFVTIDPETSEKIRKKYKEFSRGWGSLPVRCTFGKGVVLTTSIFPDTKGQKYFVYMLPVKKKIRNEIGAQNGDVISFILEVNI